MSRIGKKPIVLPQNVTANLTGQKIEVKGPNGSRCFSTSKEVEINLNENQIVIKPRNLSKKSRQHWGMNRTQIANLIEGVTTGFTTIWLSLRSISTSFEVRKSLEPLGPFISIF